MINEQARLYNLAQSSLPIQGLEPNAPRRWFWQNWQDARTANRIYQDIGERFVKSVENQTREKAAESGAVVNEALDSMYYYSSLAPGVMEPTGITFALLRSMSKRCEPIAAIHNTWVRYITAFCRRPDVRRGYVKQPGLRIKMRIPGQKATKEDLARMEELTEYILNCGYVDPPASERPVGWQRGLVSFASQAIRDSLTLDGVFVRYWKSAVNPKAVPVVSFAIEDAAKIRKVIGESQGVKDGVIKREAWVGERKNAKGKPIQWVKIGRDIQIEQEYTEEDGGYFIRNPRSDEEVGGYGFSELESGLNAITIWLSAREYNASRFRLDALPRGILTVLGALNEQQFQSFRLNWTQMLQGEGKRWGNPIFRGQAQTGAGVTWQPIDMTNRDMEYHQFLFSVSLWMHSLYGISPEETGYEGLSPFRAALSEASPESKLQSSQDKGFEPLLRWFEALLNEILWKIEPSRKYAVEFQGVGQGDEMADVEMFAAKLASGQISPRMCLDMTDTPIPEALEDDPCMDMLGVWSANHQLVMQMDAQKQQQEMASQQMEQQKQQQDQQGQLQKMQTFQQMNQQGMATPDGGQPGQPAMPGQPGQPAMPGQPGQEEEEPQQNFRKPAEPGLAIQKALMWPYAVSDMSDMLPRPPKRVMVRKRQIRVVWDKRKVKL